MAQQLARTVRDLAARYPNLPLAILVAADDSLSPRKSPISELAAENVRIVTRLPGARDEDPIHKSALYSDILAVPEATDCEHCHRAVTIRETGGLRNDDSLDLLAFPDVYPCYYVSDKAVRAVYPPRYRDDPSSQRDFEAGLRMRDRYNADLRSTRDPGGATAANRLRARTEELADRLQRYSRYARWVILVCALVAAAGQIIENFPFGSIVRPAAIAAGILVYLVTKWARIDSRYQDYRAISEALRVEGTWAALRLRNAIDESYRPMQQSELQWIRHIVKIVQIFSPTSEHPEATDAVATWVRGQLEYFGRAQRREGRKRSAFAVGGILLGLISVFGSIYALGTGLLRVAEVGWIAILATLAGVCVVVVNGYAKACAYAENENRYHRMFLVFNRANEILETGKDDPELVQRLAAELGREALAEQADWLLLQRERPTTMVDISSG